MITLREIRNAALSVAVIWALIVLLDAAVSPA